MGFREWLCRNQRPDREESTERTREVIAEAEQTREQLESLTGQLGDYVRDLQAHIRLETRRKREGKTPDGRAEA